MKAAHTPGPWVVTRGGAISTAAPEAGIQLKRGLALPQVALVVGLHEERPVGEREANEALIAAAPEMLAMLKVNEAFINDQFGTSEDLLELQALIAKAEGTS